MQQRSDISSHTIVKKTTDLIFRKNSKNLFCIDINVI